MRQTKKLMEQGVCLALSAILLAFYLVSLYQGLDHKASNGYESYYIERCLLQWPGVDGLLTEKGDSFRFDSYTAAPGQIAGHFPLSADNPWKLLEVEGWVYLEGVGYCIGGWKTNLIFDILPGEYTVTVTVYSEAEGGELTLLANGEQVAFAQLEPGTTFLTFPLNTSEEPYGRWWLTFILGENTQTPFQIQEVLFA